MHASLRSSLDNTPHNAAFFSQHPPEGEAERVQLTTYFAETYQATTKNSTAQIATYPSGFAVSPQYILTFY